MTYLILDSIEKLLGEFPVGFEPLKYIIGGFMIIFLVDCLFSLLVYMMKTIAGDK